MSLKLNKWHRESPSLVPQGSDQLRAHSQSLCCYSTIPSCLKRHVGKWHQNDFEHYIHV